jgi:hypothetical protein
MLFEGIAFAQQAAGGGAESGTQQVIFTTVIPLAALFAIFYLIRRTNKPKGLIRYVLLVVSHPQEPTPGQTFAFLHNLLPEFKKQHDGTEKIATQWLTTPIGSIDMTALAIETFGNGVMNSNYTHRTLRIGLNEGEARCLVAYDIAVKSWWQFWKQGQNS